MESGRPGVPSSLRVLKALVTATFSFSAALLLVILLHAYVPDQSLVLPAAVLAAAAAILATAAMALGIRWAWVAHPGHRKAVVFLVAITLATLLAHAYVINTPPAYDDRTPVSGAVGVQLQSADRDGGGSPLVTVTSATAGQELTVTVQATGSDAIAGLNLGTGAKLNGTGFGGTGTFQHPLQPGQSTTGVWTASGQVSTLSLSYSSLNCYSGTNREYGCIMDEVFYVPEAQGVLAGQHCFTGAGAPSDCHLEHPPLVPALLAGGMAVFGAYSAVGWRVVPAVLGSFSLPLLFGIAWKVSGSKRVAYLSSALLAMDVMFFSQSSGALLDVPEVFFGLAAFFVYFAGLRVWKLDRYILAGVFLGLAGLAKETAVFVALAFFTYLLFFGEGSRRSRIASILKVAVVVGLVFAAGVQAYDSALATSAYPNFVHNVGYILSYGSSLTADRLACQPTTGYWCRFPNQPGGPPILPTDWFTYYSPVTYFGVGICPSSLNGVCQGGAYQAVAYYGVTNLLETWTVYVWVPLVAYALYKWYRRPKGVSQAVGLTPDAPSSNAHPSGMTGEVKFAGLTLTLFLWSYIPYLFLFLAGRVTYPFYAIPAIPAVAMGASFWLSRGWFPRWLIYLYLVMVFFFFLVYFPDKGFLPVWLRSLLGH